MLATLSFLCITFLWLMLLPEDINDVQQAANFLYVEFFAIGQWQKKFLAWVMALL